MIPDGATHPKEAKLPFVDRVKSRVLGSPTVHKVLELPTGQKVEAGMSFAIAALVGMGAMASASDAVHHDAETGRAQVAWSNVGVSLLQGAFAVGCAYLGMRSLQVGVRR